jgi:chemotaxis protein methyltransferase CheR
MINSIEPYLSFFQTRYCQDLSVYNDTFLRNTINSRRVELGIETNLGYLNYLENVPDEPSRLFSQLRNSYSEFFRNSLTFSLLEQAVIPKLFDEKAKNNSGEIRAWSAGCSAGQEAYSLAILCEEFKINRMQELNCRIFATDNSVKEIELARKGVFDFKSVKNTKLGFIEKYFLRNENEFQLIETMRQQVDFSQYDLLEQGSNSPPASIWGDFDLIMCCNVLFYYKPECQQIILKKIQRSLNPGGFFVTGEAETHLVNAFGGFRSYATHSTIFMKK